MSLNCLFFLCFVILVQGSSSSSSSVERTIPFQSSKSVCSCSCFNPSIETGPCICRLIIPRFQVTCNDLDTEEELVNAISSHKCCNYINYIKRLTINSSNLNFLPSETFKGTQLAYLSLEKTSIRSLSDADSAFLGLEDYLTTLRLQECILMSEWDWQMIGGLRRLRTLEVIQTVLQDIPEAPEFENELEVIKLVEDQIQWLDDKVFANFQNLARLVLSKNKISDMKRTMLPNPASRLEILSLSDNIIDQLPTDMFINMPKLQYLWLDGNNILFLDEETFKPVMPQLLFFNTTGNEVNCDCRMRWILITRLPKDMLAVCEKPHNLKGMKLSELEENNLWCFH